MRRVIVESPFAGEEELNLEYVRACMHDCLLRGEAPFASHALYTQPGVLRDNIPEERALGIDAGFTWGKMADATVVYEDLGITPGMHQGIARAQAEGRVVERRKFGKKRWRVIPEKKRRDVNWFDRKVIKEQLLSIDPRNREEFERIRNQIARERGLSLHQIGAVCVSINNPTRRRRVRRR